MMQSLAPVTPYEGVIAENLIAIEWELLQHRRMRDAGLRMIIRDHIRRAVIKREEAAFEAALEEAWEAHEEAGGTDDDWEEPFSFDKQAAKDMGDALADRAEPARPEDGGGKGEGVFQRPPARRHCTTRPLRRQRVTSRHPRQARHQTLRLDTG